MEHAYGYRYSNLDLKANYSLIRQHSKLDIWIIGILTLLFTIMLIVTVFVRVYFSTVIRETGYTIAELTKEKIRLLEEKNRLSAEIAFLKSSQNLGKITSNKKDLVIPHANQIVRIGE